MKVDEIGNEGLEKWGGKASRRAVSIDGEKIGQIELVFHQDGTVHVNKVWIVKEKQHQGYGTRLYKKIGFELSQKGKVLISDESRSEAGEKLWLASMREGFAKIHAPSEGKNKIVYEFVPKQEISEE